MAQMVSTDETESLGIELVENGRSFRLSFRRHSFRFRNSSMKDDTDVEHALQWAAIERLPTFERLKSSLFDKEDEENLVDGKGKRLTVSGSRALEQHLFMERLIKHVEHDNLQLLQKIRKRKDKVGVKLCTVEVFKKLSSSKSHEAKINIINDVSDIIMPGRMTLLLGPPGCGKTTLLKSLSGNQDQSLKLNLWAIHFLEGDSMLLEPSKISEARPHLNEKDQIFMVSEAEQAISVTGVKRTLQTDYILKILGLDICADTLVGDVMIRGISGGQKRRLTTVYYRINCALKYTGEMIVGPTKALFMDEITNGLDSSTAYQMVACVQQLVHITDSTSLVSLLQPAPETFDLFDDIILMAEGKVVYHGPRDNVLEFFEDCGFRCPQRKGVADFLQEVISRKDQEQYWFHTELPYNYVSVDMFSRKFKECLLGKKLNEDLSEPYDKSKSHKNALSFKGVGFYPAWAYEIPATVLKIPLSLIESLVWTSLTYYVIGYSPEVWRFLRQFVLLFAMHFTSISMFRFVASVFQTVVASMAAGSFALLLVLLFGGFMITHPSMPVWMKWGFWLSPLTYGEIGISVNEFLAPRWQKTLSTNITIGRATLESRGLNYDEYHFWISLGALFGFALAFNICFTLALSFLKSPASSRAMISHETFSKIQGNEDSHEIESRNSPNTNKGRMVLPFEPLTVAFQDVQYYVDTPLEMREREFTEKNIQLLSDITGTLRPGVLTALMGVSGAGKTTLLDVLAGRKTRGYIEGEIKIGGYPKVQETFARISGYCEQTDIHSHQITVEESVIFSAWLRLAPQIDSKTKAEFVNEVLETIELDGIKDALVGIPGVNGLSTEQRKRLTIAVQLVANPSIIFMDEPTTGLDARAAAIVMRAVKNVVDTGRTIVCTTHQPSIDIFESFDELILLKTGGHIVYSGPLGLHSSSVIDYFEGIPGVMKIKDNYNPATWMLEITSTSLEAELGVDFAQKYRDSILHENNKELVRQLSTPPSCSRDLHFPTRFSQNGWGQFKSCLWKQNLSYWRSPSCNLMRILQTLAASLLICYLVFIINLPQFKVSLHKHNLFNILGSLYGAVIFLGINNCSSGLSYFAMERTVMYREKFAGMYSPWACALAQVTVEIPYLLVQAVTYVIVTYPMIGYYGSAYKIFWNFYGMFTTLLYFNYLGMVLVSLTPNFMISSILSSGFYTLFNLFTGFVIPQPVSY
ncbi:hypothetical protein Ddye_029398 [Dipteronia dyeriana]|uniref:ABC transporter domain-containing protein n=1 Tax=Dipteronia dyeriana TaxID=168575 RepID=A0AAD9WKL8_9ROSI|nr:hypothetical protein Ddye_029398 [Dipteronia dyeriana]